jgi:hypothetical protein
VTPKVAKRGQSFKGAGAYYLHDKNHANTSNRVAWTHTYNHSTDDPKKALNRMAYTAMRADKLKQRAGVSAAGRKATAGAVYTFSLSYHKEQSPTKKDMIDDAFEALEFLDLKDHQAVMVAHNDTEHPHIHVICNLVNPINGRTKQMSLDRNKFSEWAEKHEREHGKIYCPERVKNNEKRRQLKLQNQGKDKNDKTRKNGFVKHREQKIDKVQIQNLYQQSDSAKAFQAALKDAGYELAKGDRRGLVLVDDTGKIHSLSRQMKGLWKKDKSTGKWKGGLQERFKDFNEQDLRPAKDVADDRQYFDRDKQEREQLQRIEDAAIEKAKKDAEAEKQAKSTTKKKKQQRVGREIKNRVTKTPEKQYPANDDKHHLKQLDKEQAWDKEAQSKWLALERKLKEVYERKKLVKTIEIYERQLKRYDTAWGRRLGKYNELEQEIKAKKMTLENIDMRIAEERSKLENELAKTSPYRRKNQGGGQDLRPTIDFEKSQKQKKDKDEKRPSKDLDDDRTFNLDRT